MAKILIVDDERVLCELLKTLLESHGHEIFTAYDGKEAIKQFKQNRPQFTMLDLRMPETDGIETLRQIRAIDQKAAVMILTAWGTDELEQQARQLGVNDFLSKALSLDTIVGSMDRGLKPPEQAPATFTSPTDSIYLLEGKAELRDSFVRFLGRHGITVQPVKDGPAVFTMLEKERPRLLILDMDMPDLKGIAVLRALRAKNYNGGVIMMTSLQDKNLLKEAPTLGAVDILGKPVDPDRLMLAIQVGLVLIKN